MIRKKLLQVIVGAAIASFGMNTRAEACGPESYLGTVCTFAFNFCPKGWAPASGTTLRVSDYQAVSSLVSNYFGGDGRTTFGLPDLRGRSPVGTGTAPGLPTVNLGQKIGQPSVVLAVPLPEHTHQATFIPTGGGWTGTTTITVPEKPGTLTVTGTLPLATTATGAATPAAGENYLGAVTAKVGINPATFVGPYSQTSPGTTATAPVAMVVNGNPTIPQFSFDVPTGGITGGNVAVAATGIQGATMAVPTQTPAQGLTTCIMIDNGVYPPRG